MHKLLFKKNAPQSKNMMFASIEITFFSLLITWAIELLANEVLLRY